MSRVVATAGQRQLQTLIDQAAREHGVTRDALIGPGRSARLTRLRFAICWLGRNRLQLGVREIGRQLGDRNHCTIIHACNRGAGLRDSDNAFRTMTDRWIAPQEAR